jgi:hypothetical protein
MECLRRLEVAGGGFLRYVRVKSELVWHENACRGVCCWVGDDVLL